jgi:hypothetical protein
MLHALHVLGCTHDIPICTWFVLVHTKNMECYVSTALRYTSAYLSEQCTALVIWMYYAIIQESVILYIEVTDSGIPLKNGLARVVLVGWPIGRMARLVALSLISQAK